MTTGLSHTYEVLATTANEAALTVLVSGLDSRDRATREACVVGLLRRRNPEGHREILARLDEMGDAWKPLLREHGQRMTTSLRHAVVGKDPQLCENACTAILWTNNFDLIPALITKAEDQRHEHSDRAAATILQLANQLSREVIDHDENDAPQGGRDPERLRINVESTLERSVLRFADHERTEIVQAFLSLTNRDNQTLRAILQDPLHSAHRCVVDWMTGSHEAAIIQLVISFLDDIAAPRGALQIIGRRLDVPFVRALLSNLGTDLSPAVERGLKQIDGISWLRGDRKTFATLDDGLQAAALRLAMATGMPRADKFALLEYALREGKVGGRRAACEAISEFNGARSNQLVLDALDDDDPRVQATAVCQLRRRGIPGALARLISLIDYGHEVVREAAQKSLAEFKFERYVSTYDLLEEEIRRSSGELVVKVDETAIDQLARELAAPVRSRRIRAVSMAESMNVVEAVGPRLLQQLLEDDDHFVRKEAARVLAGYDTPATRLALSDAAANDRSVAVQEAAKASLRSMLTFADSLLADHAIEGESR